VKITLTENDLSAHAPDIDTPSLSDFRIERHLKECANLIEYIRPDGEVLALKRSHVCNKHRFGLEVEVSCPVDESRPDLTITREEILKSLERANYAVCSIAQSNKLTATMTIKYVEVRNVAD